MTMQPVLAFAWNAAVGIPLLIVGLIVLALIWLFGQPKKEQGKRRAPTGSPHVERREPTFGEVQGDAPVAAGTTPQAPIESAAGPEQGQLDMGLREELERLGTTLSGERGASSKPRAKAAPKLSAQVASIIDALRAPTPENADTVSVPQPDASAPAATLTQGPTSAAEPMPGKMPPRSDLGRRPQQLPVERIVTLFIVAREGHHFDGPNLVVAAEKAGLEFGDMGIYHRLLDGKRELGPIFSVANMLKPGNFDLGKLDSLKTPGVSFFMTLPAPLPALDAWDAMLPTAQRLAELLDGQLLDEERNALGRQGIAHIRDQLRSWDRDHEGDEVIFGR